VERMRDRASGNGHSFSPVVEGLDGVFDDAGDVLEAGLRKSKYLLPGEYRLAAPPDRLVAVHAAMDRLRYDRRKVRLFFRFGQMRDSIAAGALFSVGA